MLFASLFFLGLLGGFLFWKLKGKKLLPHQPMRWHDNRHASSNPLLKAGHQKHVCTKATGLRYLVTGGNGFLGSHIVEGLLARGERHIRILDVFDSGRFRDTPGVEFVSGNLAKKEDVDLATAGIDVVFHTAALILYWASHDWQIPPHHRVNVEGTDNLVQACKRHGVKKLIFTSSTNVMMTHDGRKIPDVDKLDETAPYQIERPCSPYGLTKALAEKIVIAGNDANGLLTVAIRPPGIFGERDKLVEALVLEELPLGLMGYMGVQDWIYVENLVHAHLLAEEKLAPGSGVDGEAFFVTNGESGFINGGDLYVRVAEAVYKEHFKFDRDTLTIPLWILYSIAYCVDGFHWLTNGKYTGHKLLRTTPICIQYVVPRLSFDDTKARRLLGYKEIYTLQEGFTRMGIYNRGS